MIHGRSDDEIIRGTHNTARFFTETPHIAWVALLATVLWGVYGYLMMPKRKDPDIPVRVAVTLCPWPGAAAEKVEQLITRRLEEKIAENAHVTELTSASRSGIAIVWVELDDRVEEPGKEFDDIQLKLDSVDDLPDGAGPIQFIKDFGDTAALMLTVASPRAGDVEVSVRALEIRRSIEAVRAGAPVGARRATLVICVPDSVDPRTLARSLAQFAQWTTDRGYSTDLRPILQKGFIAMDAGTGSDEATILRELDAYIRERLRLSELHADVWRPIVVFDPAETEAKLAAVAGARYSYRDLDDATDLIKRTLQTVPQVSKVSRSGVREEAVYLDYSQERLASYGLQAGRLRDLLSARNITFPGGLFETGGKNLTIDPSGEFRSEAEIGDVLVATSESGTGAYLRDIVDIHRDYEVPARFLNFYISKGADGSWSRSRAITLSVQMRSGEQIALFGEAVDAALESLRRRLPADLILARTSDQPLQVRENVDLFNMSLYEAIVLVVVVALIGFWEWRSAFLMSLSIPLTLAMTYGMMYVLGIDLQQISIGSLIIALGLLVDDPVVAGDSIKRELAAGRPSSIAAWLGPTKLATAILFATITNIVAYLPLLLLPGDTGRFLYTMPVVLACSLVASRIVSMTFIPFLGRHLLRAPSKPEPSMEERRQRGFAGFYFRIGGAALRRRWAVLVGSFGILALGAWCFSTLAPQFFPKDLQYYAYLDVWLPEDAPLSATNEAALRAESIVREVVEAFEREVGGWHGGGEGLLRSITTFVGGGGPRFWFSVQPEIQQLNYAQVLIQTTDKHETRRLVGRLQTALTAGIPGARIDVQQLETGKPVGLPVAIRITGDDIGALRAEAARAAAIFRAIPDADRVRDDWGEESFVVRLKVDPDRANLAGISNLDVALSSATAMSGLQVTTLREGDDQIPVYARLRASERAQLEDIRNLYVYSTVTPTKVPLRQVSTLEYEMETAKIRRRNQFRTITVSCMPVPGVLPSIVLRKARPALEEFERSLPPGMGMEIGGEEEEQVKGFRNLSIVLVISVALIYFALVAQFRNAIKPFIVFAAIPYGVTGAVAALALMGQPFGFMGFLGIASLIGVIVSHVIVLFDFIEEAHAHGRPFEAALLEAGIIRLRPVLITVAATVFALFPLAAHGGPIWEPLCYAQIGGLTLATFVTLLLVPVLYAICVRDLKIVKWETVAPKGGSHQS